MQTARLLYRQALKESPNDSIALFRFGLLELQEANPAAALPLILAAVTAEPGDFRFQFGHGQTLSALSRWSEATDAFRRALKIDPASFDASLAIGNTLVASGDLPAAVESFEAALQIEPDSAAALSNLGVALRSQQQTARALQCLRRAVELEPKAAAHAINLAAALSDARHFSEAAVLLRHAIQLEPDNADALFNLGVALQGAGDLTGAIESYRRVISLAPTHVDALNNLGSALKLRGEFGGAMAAFQSAIQARPDFVQALNNAGCLLRTLGRLEEAEAMLRRGLKVHEKHPALWDNLGSVLKDSGQLDGAIDCYRRSLALDPGSAQTHSNLLFSLSFSSCDPQPILDQSRRWNQLHAQPLKLERGPGSVDRTSNQRLRIGYVSPDFREHCQSFFTIPLLSNHDHLSFKIFCYSSVERPDAITKRIARYADVWQEVRHLDDASLAQLIRKDGIDILIDLTMHMSGGRPLLFARKPAPVQIAWLAYPGTTGIAAMDYRLSDPRLDPVEFDSHYTERTIRLADSFWCYHPLTDQPEVNELPALSNGFVTFGCLNNPCKLTDQTLELWSGVLRELPASRLKLMAPPGAYRHQLLERFSMHDVANDRIDFLSYRPRAEYLRSYHQIDLGLDTFPYNGHTTSLDSFWMGVPVVTRTGNTCVGRGGLSQLHQLNLLELAAFDDASYTNITVGLANDLPRLKSLRYELRSRLQQSPLMDGRRFAREMELNLRRLFEAYPADHSA